MTGREGLARASGNAQTPIEPGQAGLVFLEGALWRAVAGSAAIGVGQAVVVQGVDGLTLTGSLAPSPGFDQEDATTGTALRPERGTDPEVVHA